MQQARGDTSDVHTSTRSARSAAWWSPAGGRAGGPQPSVQLCLGCSASVAPPLRKLMATGHAACLAISQDGTRPSGTCVLCGTMSTWSKRCACDAQTSGRGTPTDSGSKLGKRWALAAEASARLHEPPVALQRVWLRPRRRPSARWSQGAASAAERERAHLKADVLVQVEGHHMPEGEPLLPVGLHQEAVDLCRRGARREAQHAGTACAPAPSGRSASQCTCSAPCLCLFSCLTRLNVSALTMTHCCALCLMRRFKKASAHILAVILHAAARLRAPFLLWPT